MLRRIRRSCSRYRDDAEVGKAPRPKRAGMEIIMQKEQKSGRGRRRAAALLLSVLAGAALLTAGCGEAEPSKSDDSVRIGVTLYDQYDTFLAELMESFNGYVDARKAEGVDIVTVVRDAARSQAAQNDEVADMIESGCDVICVNLVDRTAPTEIIDIARKNDVPVIFFNRELVEEDLMQWDQLYYVGADAFQSGTIQGEMATQYCKGHPEADQNGDGTIQYVVLEGEAGHQDAIIRTEYSVDTMISNGILLDKAGYAIANWNRAQARTKMGQLIDSSGKTIELVLANNDDMALGAIEAYQDKEIPESEWPAIFGIDGTGVGLEAVVSGQMTGTVYNDKDGQARAMEALAYALASGSYPEGLKLPDQVAMEDNKYIRLPYREVDREQAEEILAK